MSVRHLPGYELPPSHPLAGREAYQCDRCRGIFYPEAKPELCPYCEEKDVDD